MSTKQTKPIQRKQNATVMPTLHHDKLDREFYLSDAVSVARGLLGKRLVHVINGEETSGIIVETEAYAGHDDAACHSYLRKGPDGNHRTNIMFADGGLAYVYLIYGMYHCFNVVANVAENPEAVLIRAIQPLDGIAIMQKRRNIFADVKNADKKLCNGPGKLCIAMGITREQYGKDLRGDELFITKGQPVTSKEIAATPRINVDYAGEASEYFYRFVIKDSPYLSMRKGIEKNKRES